MHFKQTPQFNQETNANSNYNNAQNEQINFNHCLPIFLRKEVNLSDEEDHESEQDYEKDSPKDKKYTPMYFEQQEDQQGYQDTKYLKQQKIHNNTINANRFGSFDDLNQYCIYPYQTPTSRCNDTLYHKQLHPTPSPQHQYHLQSGYGYPSQQIFNYPQLHLQHPHNNYPINSFNYLPNQVMIPQTPNYRNITYPKSQKNSMMDITPSHIMPEVNHIQPTHKQSFTLPTNQPLKNKAKKTKKTLKNNNHSDKGKINMTQAMTPQALFSISDKNLASYIMTQKGSREIQSILSKLKTEAVELLLLKLSSSLPDLMISQYGNYFSRGLIIISSLSQRVIILETIQSRFVEISCNVFGTHPLQSLIEIINLPKEKEILAKCIEGNELELSLDENGTHVLQKFLSCTNQEEREGINRNIISHIPRLICNKHGVCILNKLIDHSSTMTHKQSIAAYISQNNPLGLIQDQYANYVVKTLINKTDIVLCKDIIAVVVENFFMLSMMCYSCNVVENCLRFSEEEVVMKIYSEVLLEGKLGMMLKNTYGAFVIEKLVGRLKQDHRAEIIKEVFRLGKEVTLSNAIIGLLYK